MSNTKEGKLSLGAEVATKRHGVGMITGIGSKTVDGEDVRVYDVALENGETRHFTADELK